jgi:two-component system NtrC family response regulator
MSSVAERWGSASTVEKPSLLVVANDEALRLQYASALRDDFALAYADNRQGALKQFAAVRPPLVHLDLGLPARPTSVSDEQVATLRDILRVDAAAKVVVSGSAEERSACRMLQLGAIDYLSRPVDVEELRLVLRRAAYRHRLETHATPSVDPSASEFEGIIGSTPRMKAIFAILAQVARTDVTVLLQGDSGTGKELAARAIVARSPRRDGPFVAINCGAIPETLLETELFGSEKGAYTGALARRKGQLEMAHGGTLFLDEVGEMSPALQVKLLRFLQERQFTRVGGHESIAVDTRIIVATNKDLKAEIRAGRFREDVYYRIAVVVIALPPLRERSEDIILLANTFLQQYGERCGRRLRLSPRAVSAIAAHGWPGNIRELENAVQRAVVMTQGAIVEPQDLALLPAPMMEATTLRGARTRAERAALVDALTRTKGNISVAARNLAISRPAMHELLKKHQLEARFFR